MRGPPIRFCSSPHRSHPTRTHILVSLHPQGLHLSPSLLPTIPSPPSLNFRVSFLPPPLNFRVSFLPPPISFEASFLPPPLNFGAPLLPAPTSVTTLKSSPKKPLPHEPKCPRTHADTQKTRVFSQALTARRTQPPPGPPRRGLCRRVMDCATHSSARPGCGIAGANPALTSHSSTVGLRAG